MSDNAFSSLSRRQLLALGGGLAAVGALAACGGNTGREPSTGGAGKGDGKVALQQWYHQYGEKGVQQAVEGYAKEYAEANVQVSWKPGDYDKPTAASLLTDSGPDVFEYGNGPTIDMIKGGQVVDLTDVVGDVAQDFNPNVIKRHTYQGKVWSIPQVIDMQLLVYKKSTLEQAGIKPPSTIDELWSAAKALTNDQQKGLFVGNDGGAGLLGGPMLWAAGLDYLKDDNTFGFDDPRAIEAFKKLRELFASGSLLLGAPKDWFDASALTSGQAAMQFTGLWTFPDIKKALGEDFGCIPWPAMAGGKQSVPVGAYASCVSAKSKNVDAAKKFVQWLWVEQTDKQLDFATAYGFHIPARTSLIAKASSLTSGPAADAARYATQVGHAQSPILWTPKCNAAFSDMMSRIVKDGADPRAEIATVKAVADGELKRVLA